MNVLEEAIQQLKSEGYSTDDIKLALEKALDGASNQSVEKEVQLRQRLAR
ncbi:hypothetical protein [Jeotgalibacillus soli]|uniref:Uncharacterized protein n=1 Tax=Jeotgalibacillus soli TaxID=889306 RepID=A0A0C2R8W1_9BACL|nr:hypothetical protein [Jeotgalibacillus soli]KIL46735.1 hypothetical protein KP78_18530 [Jeotgalibacillus soli]